MKVLIDPGHRNNDRDYGATGNGYKESELSLQIAKKLKKQLEKHNIVCYMSRDTEQDVIGLNERCRKANSLNVDLYLSVHINSAERKEATGIEVLYYDAVGLAKKTCDSMCKATGVPSRGAKKRTDLCVLNSTKMPSILVECGFISNSVESKLLASDSYQEKLAVAICSAVVAQYKIVVPSVPKKEVYKVEKTKLELNGRVKEVSAVNINGNYYIKLRDLQDDRILVDYSNRIRMPVVKTLS